MVQIARSFKSNTNSVLRDLSDQKPSFLIATTLSLESRTQDIQRHHLEALVNSLNSFTKDLHMSDLL